MHDSAARSRPFIKKDPGGFKMEKKRRIWKWISAVLVIASACALGFLGGRYEADLRYRAERERNQRIERSELEGLGEIKGTIYVTGHKNPDADTVGSSIGYAALLRALGYDAVPVVLGDINKETECILKEGGIQAPQLLEDAAGRNIVLVDHSDYLQSAEGLKDANVIAVIDHHRVGSVTTGNRLIYDARPLGSTATIVWMRCRDYGVGIDRETAYAMTGSVLSDTINLASNATTFADREALKELSQLAGISDTDALYRKMYKALISYEGMTDEEIFLSDYKEYELSGVKTGIGCINVYDEDGSKDMAERMRRVFASPGMSSGMDLYIAEITIFHDGISVTRLVPSNEAADGVLRAAFGDEAVYDGVSYRLEPGVSRKQVLVPAITEVLNGGIDGLG